MIDRKIEAAADGGLHAAQCARLARHQGTPALPPVESTTLLGADPPCDDRISRSTIYSADQTSSFDRVRRITSSVKSVIVASPPRSAVLTPCATASSAASRIA